MTATTEPRNVTTRQRDVLRAFARWAHVHGGAPTLAWIAREFGISRATAHEHCEQLTKRGLLDHSDPFCSRGRRLTNAGLKAARAGGWEPDPLERLQSAWAEATPAARRRFLRQIGGRE